MKEHECQTCGGPLVFKGSVLSGKVVCPHCESQPVVAFDPAEDISTSAAVAKREIGKMGIGSFASLQAKIEQSVRQNNKILEDLYVPDMPSFRSRLSFDYNMSQFASPHRGGKNALMIRWALAVAKVRGPVAVRCLPKNYPSLKFMLERNGAECLGEQGNFRHKKIATFSLGEAGSILLIASDPNTHVSRYLAKPADTFIDCEAAGKMTATVFDSWMDWGRGHA